METIIPPDNKIEEEEEAEAEAIAARRAKYDDRLRRVFGITIEQYDAQFAAQEGKCCLCGALAKPSPTLVGGLVVDHDHQTGEIRALLCSKCNTGLGQFNDDPALLRLAAEYVEYYRNFGRKNA